ncbi:hypothetical protein SAMN04489761_3345 [Tenacibaculum sp. MAR_2009_124]|uniref:hypothetical protein n=1 Tax=Tenacibaculum sp. MAR_2009_124 TaxID=1250059 RepID=UPI00089585D9|nr:hypothetical protein [Tenacibaculum sp. MAR_2009_124]SEC56684.1 hypothetical protein SAMN04489761_3345 [Tenacibaculum sp. MAR_2009_124]
MDFFKQNHELLVVNALLCSNEPIYICTQVKKIGDKIKADGESVVYKRVEELKKFAGDKGVVLLLNGEKVLYTSKGELFKSTINLFYTTKYITKANKGFLALARKEEVEGVVESFLGNNIFLIDLYIGSFSVGLFYKKYFVNKEFKTSYFSLFFDNEDCIEVEKNTNSLLEIEIDNEKEAMIALSLLYDHYYPSDRLISSYENSVITENKSENVHKSEFRFYGKIALMIVFAIMSLSFGITVFFSIQNEEIESKLNYLIQEESLLNKLSKERSKKEEILRISGVLNSDGISYWTNTIVKNIPESILLSELEVFPLEQKIKENKKVDIDGTLIIVRGISFDENRFNNWVKMLTLKEEIFKINIINYSQKKEQEVRFELKVELNR